MHTGSMVKITMGIILSIGAICQMSSSLQATTKDSKLLVGQKYFDTAELLPKIIGPKTTKSIVDSNWKRAASLYYNACMNGVGKSCESAAFYAHDFLLASKALHHGCYNLNNGETCSFGGLFFTFPAGFVDKNINPSKKDLEKKSKKYYSRGCDLNAGSACANIGFEHWLSKRFALAEQVLKKACGLKDARGCNHLAHFYFNNFATREKGISTLKYSCSIGSLASCTTLGAFHPREAIEGGCRGEIRSFLVNSN